MQRETCAEGSESFTQRFSSTAHRFPSGLPACLLPQKMLGAFREGHKTAFWDDPLAFQWCKGITRPLSSQKLLLCHSSVAKTTLSCPCPIIWRVQEHPGCQDTSPCLFRPWQSLLECQHPRSSSILCYLGPWAVFAAFPPHSATQNWP